MGQLEGKVAYITGAASGIGRSCALRLAEEGAGIIAVDLCAPVGTVPYDLAGMADLEETVRLVAETGRRAIAAVADVRDSVALAKAASAGAAEFGRLDIVVANAGISAPAPTLEMDDAVWANMIDINLTGQWKTVKATVPHIIAGGAGGAVVVMSSLAALKPFENSAHYCASKAGVTMLAQVLALELAEHAIRVNTVHPTTVRTDMVYNDRTYQSFRPDLESPTSDDFEEAARSLNRLPVAALDPQDVSNAVLYVVSDAGRYVTGAEHVIDAGARL